MATEDIHVLAMVRNDEQYIFLFSDINADRVRQQFGRWASRGDLAFSWFDAAKLNERLRRVMEDS